MTRRKLIQLVLFLFVIAPATVFSSELELLSHSLNFRHITPKDGLSHNMVNSVLQDKQGYIWFGTSYGLERFDGLSFDYFTNVNTDSLTISSSRISKLFEDNHGTMWIGTWDGGLNRLERGADNANSRAISFSNFNCEGIGNSINHIYQDRDSTLWVATADRGVSCYNHKSRSFQHFPIHNNTLSITSICEFGDRYMLIGTRNGGLLFFDKEKGETTEFPLQFKDTSEKVLNIHDIKIFDGKIYLASDSGLHYCSIVEYQRSRQFNFERLSIDTQHNISSFYSIYQHSGALWCGTNKGLVVIFCDDATDTHSYRVFQSDPQKFNTINGNIINDIIIDRMGVLWVATDLGVSYCNLYAPNITNHYNKLLNNDLISCIFEDSYKQLWLGMQSGSLFKFSPQDDNWVEYTPGDGTNGTFISMGSIDDITEDRFGTLWISSWGEGLNRLDLHAERKGRVYFEHYGVDNGSKSPSEGVVTSVEYFNGRLYVGTFHRGLDIFDFDNNGNIIKAENCRKGDNESDEVTIVSNRINNIYSDMIEDCLWISTPDGLSKMKEGVEQRFTNFTMDGDENRISHNFVWEVVRTSAEELWVGTIEDGLNCLKFDPVSFQQVDLEVFRKEQGLASNSIQSILYDDLGGNLWIGANVVSMFNIESGLVRNIDQASGLIGNYFRVGAATKTSNNRLVFGSNQGVNIITPTQTTINPYPPTVHIHSLLVYGEPYPIASYNTEDSKSREVKLKHNENSLSFEFVALHYANPTKNHYEYMLEGVDKDWSRSVSDRRSATYSNLAHGRYAFKVRASNSDDVWKESVETLYIVIRSPWWLTWWAYLLYFSILIGLIYTIVAVLNNRRKILSKLELEKHKAKENEELNMLKLRFFTNISHELRTPLTLIVDPLESILKVEGLDPNLRYYMLTMHRNAERLLRLFNQLLDFRKVETGNMQLHTRAADVVSYIKAVSSSFNSLACSKQIEMSIDSDFTTLIAWIDRDFIEKILYNLLSNSFKHTQEGGKIRVSIKESNSPICYTIKVSDTGRGIEKSKHHLVFERYYQSHSADKRGTGIGLALVKRLVESHYGSIELQSDGTQGTTFIVTLPLGNEFMRDDERDSDDFEEIDFEEFNIKNKMQEQAGDKQGVIVIAEDDKELAEYLGKELSKEYIVHTAVDGVEAFDMVTRVKPDLLLTDVLMPNMDGLTLCKKLKHKSAYRAIPVIMLTAKATESDKLEGTECGADAYIYKPFKLEYLHSKIKNLISERKKMRQFYASNKDESQPESNPERDEFLRRAESIVFENLNQVEFSSEEFAKQMNLSYSTLYNKLKEYVNCSVSEYVRLVRLKEAARLIANSSMNISQICYVVGFNDLKYFRENFKKLYGVTPSIYLKTYRKLEL